MNDPNRLAIHQIGCLLFWLSPFSLFLRADFQTGIGETGFRLKTGQIFQGSVRGELVEP